jgi:hypothetical protein
MLTRGLLILVLLCSGCGNDPLLMPTPLEQKPAVPLPAGCAIAYGRGKAVLQCPPGTEL